jgi:hypothetical protein
VTATSGSRADHTGQLVVDAHDDANHLSGAQRRTGGDASGRSEDKNDERGIHVAPVEAAAGVVGDKRDNS